MFVKFNLEKIMIKDYLDNTLEIRNKPTKFVDASSRRKCQVERERERQRAPKITLSIMPLVVIITKNDNAPNYMMTKIWEFNLLLRGYKLF